MIGSVKDIRQKALLLTSIKHFSNFWWSEEEEVITADVF